MPRKGSIALLARNTHKQAPTNRFASLKDEHDIYEQRINCTHFAALPMAKMFGVYSLQYNACLRKTGAAFMAEIIELFVELKEDIQEGLDALSLP